MAQGNIRTSDIKGFTPAVEPTRSQELFILNGKNYVFDTLGPKSVFGNRVLLPQPLGKPQHTQGIRLKLRTGDRAFTITGDSILEWSEALGGWRVIYVTPDTTLSPYRWTWGYLNNKMFFCHPRTGILVYDLETQVCVPHDGPGVPAEAIGIVINNGILVAIDAEFFYYSAPSDGMNFNPTLGGAGFQRISDRVSGYPIMVTSYTRGCLTWTTGGVMRSEFTGDAAVYRHRALQTEYRPVNSFCSCRIDDDTVVILDERGLFQSKGEAPTAFAPLFNEFLGPYIQDNDLRVGDNLRVEWDELERRLYVSTSLSYSDSIFENCFVYYPNLDKWGQFNERHYGILPLRIDGSERSDDFYGFVDSAGVVRVWQEVGSRELVTLSGAGVVKAAQNLVYPPIQQPATYPEGDSGIILSSSAITNTISTATLTQVAGYYELDAMAPAEPELTGLDASIQIGLYRPVDQDSSDRMSELLTVLIRSIQSGPQDQVSVDFSLIPNATADEDYNVISGSDDYGFENLNYVNHGFRIISTIDGVTEFGVTTPSLVAFAKGVRYYSCTAVGLWHILEMTANQVGESFHPVTLEITATDAGRLL
jgi:hypothetical protein